MLRTRAEALDDLERQMRSEADFAGERIVRTGERLPVAGDEDLHGPGVEDAV